MSLMSISLVADCLAKKRIHGTVAGGKSRASVFHDRLVEVQDGVCDQDVSGVFREIQVFVARLLANRQQLLGGGPDSPGSP